MAIEDVDGGGNNRLYRIIDASGRPLALKWYPPRQAGDTRDRLATEFGALTFLESQGVSVVPQAVAADAQLGFALYQWVEGRPATEISAADIDQAVAFAALLRRLAGSAAASFLPLASEACLSAGELIAQVERRRARLAEVTHLHPDLAAYLDERFDSVFAKACARLRRGYARRHWDTEAAIALADRTLSPSDFGFHNAIRQADGRLVFVDFEYFGWDDPVRLAADFPLHPGMGLDPELSARWDRDIRSVFSSGDTAFQPRLDLLYPLIGLRWCMILLNEFLPERWSRRQLAGARLRQEDAAAIQLTKSDRLLASIAELLVA